MNQLVLQAKAEMEEAARRLMEETKHAFPKGCIISAELGTRQVIGEVIGHSGCWWHEPDAVFIRNIHTGKERRVRAAYEIHNVTIIETAEEVKERRGVQP